MACVSGPEVYVGVGSHEPVRSMKGSSQVPSVPPMGHFREDWSLLSWFRSSITGNYEMVRDICTQPVQQPGCFPLYRPPGVPGRLRRPECKPAPLMRGRNRHWPVAQQHYLRPFMACKALYYEAQREFFRNRHFVLGSSTYALAWLRRIGRRNAMNIRSVRFKIHREFYLSTGRSTVDGVHWDEVLNRLRRVAPGLRVLGLHCEEGHAQLQDIQRFLRRAPAFLRLRRVDLYVWGVDDFIRHPSHHYFWYRGKPSRGVCPAAVTAMMESFLHQTRVPIRFIEICRFLVRNSSDYNAPRSEREWYLLPHEVRPDRGDRGAGRATLKDQAAFLFTNGYVACL